MNIAVIGIGNMGRHHARIFFRLQKEGLVNLKAVCDINPEMKKIADDFGCVFYTDYKKMLENKKLDAVSVVVPTSLHEKVVLDCLENNVNILVEKPIASSLESAERMVKKAKEKNLQLMVGHIERFNPVVRALKQMFEDGELGEILSIDSKRLGMPRISDTGVAVDLAIHDVDIIMHLMNEKPVSIYSVTQNKITPNNVEDYINIILQFKNGVVARVEANRIAPIKLRELFITGTKAYCKLNYIDQTIEITESFIQNKTSSWEDFQEFLKKFQPETKTIRLEKEEPLYLELKSFIQSLKNGQKVPVSGEEAIEVLKIILLALESSRKNQIIKL